MRKSSISRIVVCGAVDDGKSTLIGRMLFETGSVPLDELSQVQKPDGSFDFSRLTDGLEAEREQGITIDVAYRYLGLPRGKRALLADSPGHEQYTRNMAVAASTAEVALIVVDAERGISTQTKRHASICQLMGVQEIVVAINKIDCLPTSETEIIINQLTQKIHTAFFELSLNISNKNAPAPTITVIPVSGLRGDNVLHAEPGKVSLLDALYESIVRVDTHEVAANEPTRLPIQAVIRRGNRRWYSGRLATGAIAVGDEVVLWPSLHHATIEEIYVNGSDSQQAVRGQSVAVSMDHEVDLSRGDLIAAAQDQDRLNVSRAHLTTLVWIGPEPLNRTTSYLLRVGPYEVPIKCEVVRYHINLETNSQTPSSALAINEIGCVEITADRPFILDPYFQSRDTGGFVLCDRLTGNTVAAGMSLHPLQRTSEVTRHSFSVTRELRESLNGFRGGVMWLTGLPGSGKSTIADELERLLYERGIRSFVLDGDMVRQTLSSDLGFSPTDRKENIRRVAQVAHMMMDAGLIVIVCLVSPSAADREAARELYAQSDFVEVFVDTPLKVCQERDPKGLYAKAATDISMSMTGVGQTYEPPVDPEILLDGTQDVGNSCQVLLEWVTARRV